MDAREANRLLEARVDELTRGRRKKWVRRALLQAVTNVAGLSESVRRGELKLALSHLGWVALAHDARLSLSTDVERVRAHFAKLGIRYQQVLIMRYGLEGEPPTTLQQVGVKLKLTRQRVAQLQSSALHRLKKVTIDREVETVTKTVELTFTRERETKNTVRYQELTDSAPIVGTLYVQKWFAKGADRLKVTLTIEDKVAET